MASLSLSASHGSAWSGFETRLKPRSARALLLVTAAHLGLVALLLAHHAVRTNLLPTPLWVQLMVAPALTEPTPLPAPASTRAAPRLPPLPLPEVVSYMPPTPLAPAETLRAAEPPAAPVTVTTSPPVLASALAVPAPAAQPEPPRLIPPSAVQYLAPPVLEYPRLSRKAGEQGRVLVRVFIDEAGLPASVAVSQSSGFIRLDEAAQAAVRRTRFKPYTVDGRPASGWAVIPMTFNLDQTS